MCKGSENATHNLLGIILLGIKGVVSKSSGKSELRPTLAYFQVRSRDISIEEWKGSETYSPSTAYGVDFLVPVMGYICRICHKFYHSNSGAQLSHCKSLAHFENLQKYKKAKNPSPTSRPVSRRCAINARNALTALFTSGGRAPTQPSTQDTAKTPSKVTAQPPPPPLPRRSTRLKT